MCALKRRVISETTNHRSAHWLPTMSELESPRSSIHTFISPPTSPPPADMEPTMEKIGLDKPLPIVHNTNYYLEDEMSVFLVGVRLSLAKSDSLIVDLFPSICRLKTSFSKFTDISSSANPLFSSGCSLVHLVRMDLTVSMTNAPYLSPESSVANSRHFSIFSTEGKRQNRRMYCASPHAIPLLLEG